MFIYIDIEQLNYIILLILVPDNGLRKAYKYNTKFQNTSPVAQFTPPPKKSHSYKRRD